MIDYVWILKTSAIGAIAVNLAIGFSMGNLNIALSHGMETKLIDDFDNLANRHSLPLTAKDLKQTIATVYPVAETAEELESNNPQNPFFDADDPAIYLHPEDPRQSFVITTFKEGGLGVYDLMGKPIQSISPPDIRYNNVDVVYGVEYPSQMLGEVASVDLAIASDRRNDTLAIFKINPDLNLFVKNPLEEIVSISVPDSIFGIDDTEATAYGLTAYISKNDGKTYVFVSQSDGNKIAQLEIQPSLGAADELTVDAKIIRTFAVPIPPNISAKEAFVEGMVVDRETEFLYLAQEKFGIWKISLDSVDSIQESLKDSHNTVDLVNRIKPDSPLNADIEGLTIYYDRSDRGYLIASSQGDSTFAVYDSAGDNPYLGSFAIEGVKQTDGLDITSIPLGEKYPEGMLIVQDGLNKVPQVDSNSSGKKTQYLKTNFKFVSAKDIFELF